jgi:hypothetical protein
LVCSKIAEANGGFLETQLNEGVIKRKIRKVPTKNKTFDSGKKFFGN